MLNSCSIGFLANTEILENITYEMTRVVVQRAAAVNNDQEHKHGSILLILKTARIR